MYILYVHTHKCTCTYDIRTHTHTHTLPLGAMALSKPRLEIVEQPKSVSTLARQLLSQSN